MLPFQHVLILAAVLFALGIAVVFTRRSPIFSLVGLELMLNATNINLVAFSRLDPALAQGQVFALFIILIAAAETAVILAIIIAIARLNPKGNAQV